VSAEHAALTVIVADDHGPYRDGIARGLQAAGLDVVASAEDGSAALELIRELRPDVALVDLRMPGTTGADVARALAKGVDVRTRVVIISARADRALVDLARRAGAHGYVSKDASLRQIASVVDLCARGELVFPAYE
jgi:two-component system, NarL family, nitrate/nitrite response regulator NarL